MRTRRSVLNLALILSAFWALLSILVVWRARTAACDWKLAAIVGDEGNRELYVASESAPTLQNLSNTVEADEYDPVWSPGGRYLAFVSERFDTRAINLQVMDTASGEIQILAEAVPYHAYHAAWSPDGLYLALRNQLEGLTVVEMSSGTPVVNLDVDSRYDLPLAWSPDSTRIVFTTPDMTMQANGERWYVMVADIATGSTEALATFEFNGNSVEARRPYWLYWLPDDRIVVTRQYPGGPENAVYTLDPREGRLELLVERITTLGKPALSTQSRLLYSTARDLHELDLYSGAVHSLTANPRAGIFEQAILPPGDVITFNTYQQAGTLYWMDIRNGRMHTLLTEPRLEDFAWGAECV